MVHNIELTSDELAALETVLSGSISSANIDLEYDGLDFGDVTHMKLCYLRALILEKLQSAN